MNSAGQPSPGIRWLRVIFNTVVCLGILAGTAFGVWWIYQNEPTAQQINTKRKSAAIVETVTVKRDTWSPRLVVLGTVEPAQDIVLSPRVRGQVQNLSPSFVPGGMICKGELLLQIDPADFENVVSIRKSELEQVEASWEIEEGRQSLAKQELKLLGDSIDDVNRALVLREPQAASIKSQLNASRAAVERAELDLARTRLVAPFDAQVLRRSVNVGSQVQPGDDLGQLVGIEEYWVIAAIPVRNLRWVQFPGGKSEGSVVTLHNPDAWGNEASRQGRVARMIGSLDEETRLARVLVTVNDPLGQTSDAPPLILDTLIEARITGKPINDVVRLDRDYVHDGDTVWVMNENQLEIRDTQVVFRDPDYAYISSGLENGDEVVTTTLATVADGVMLRKVDASSDGGSDAESPDAGEASEADSVPAEPDASPQAIDNTSVETRK